MERACADQGDEARNAKTRRSPFKRIVQGFGKIITIPDQGAKRAYGYTHLALQR